MIAALLLVALVGGMPVSPGCHASGQLNGLFSLAAFPQPLIARAARLPDRITRPLPVTPGLTRPLSKATVCKTHWGKDLRHVSEDMKQQVAAAYGITYPLLRKGHRLTAREKALRAKWEIDHLIPRELAGADDVRNLWPQPYEGPWSAHAKDRLENHLRVLVCAGSITLAFAQESIASDWIASYRIYVAAK